MKFLELFTVAQRKVGLTWSFFPIGLKITSSSTYLHPCMPVLLLMDGHSSHICPDMIRMAAKKKVILFTLPPNTTHLTQPLDKGCFGPLKV